MENKQNLIFINIMRIIIFPKMLENFFRIFAAILAVLRLSRPSGGWTLELKAKCDAFWKALTEDPTNKNLRTTLGELLEALGEANPNLNATTLKTMTRRLARVYIKVAKFLQIKVTFTERLAEGADKVMTQKVTEITLAEYMNQLRKQHIHQDVINGTGRTCSCSYHEEELFYHLLIAGICAGFHAKTCGNHENAFLAIVTAMLHDIGKVATMQTTEKGYVAYPFHGEMGALILSGIYTDKISAFMTQAQFETMIRVISIHMCSYHLTNFSSYWDKERVKSTRLESPEVKLLLASVSFGDTFAAFSQQNDVKSWLESRETWWQEINKPYRAPKGKNKVLVVMRGQSCSGKSTVSNLIADGIISKNCTVVRIERDVLICQAAAKAVKEPFDENTRPEGEDYKRLYAIYKSKRLGAIVNNNMKEAIHEAYAGGAHVVIVDTVGALYPGFEKSLPTMINQCMIIAVDVNGNAPITDSKKNGIEHQEQLSLSGERSMWAPFQGKDIDFGKLASRYTFANAPATMAPHFVYQVGWNAEFNGPKSIGLNDTISAIRNMIMRVQGRKIPDTNSMNIVDYTNYAYSLADCSYDGLVEHYKSLNYHAGPPSQLRKTAYEKRFLNVKYLEHNNNWSFWGRQARGTTLYLNDDGQWVLWKFLMLRGAEMLTTLHTAQNIKENENVQNGKISHLAKEQQELFSDLAADSDDLNLMVTFKKDGSLLSCCLFSGKKAKVMRKVITECGDEFTKTVMATYDATVGHTKDVFIFQSQGTLWLTKEMYDYTTTALFGTIEGFQPNLSPIEKIRTYGPAFFKNITQLFDNLPSKGDIKLILGETICANRTESFSGSVHTELAVAYETSSFTVISSTVIQNDGRNFSVMPHFEISEQIHNAGFMEPAFWNVTSSGVLNTMLEFVDEVSWGRKTVKNFYDAYPPSNHFGFETVVDREGFVIYDVLREMSYGKIKSALYYFAHKFRPSNVPLLLELAKHAGGAFPLAVIVRDVIAPLDELLSHVRNELAGVIDDLVTQLPPGVQSAYDRAEPQRKPMIVIKNCKDAFTEYAFGIFYKAFPQLEAEEKEDIAKCIMEFSSNGGVVLDAPIDYDNPKMQAWRSNLVKMLLPPGMH
jgi:hypothetical protein